MKNITFVTGNKTKILHANEALAKFGYLVVPEKLLLTEPREENPKEVVIEKAIQAFKQIGKPLIVEDSGIFIRALKGFPKTFIRFAEDTIGMAGILKLMEGIEDRNAEFRQSLAYIEPGMEKPKVFSYIDGGYTVADKIYNSDKSEDYGEFDRILIPPNENVPLCMFSKEENAKRDVTGNQDKIHYKQLAIWLNTRERN